MRKLLFVTILSGICACSFAAEVPHPIVAEAFGTCVKVQGTFSVVGGVDIPGGPKNSDLRTVFFTAASSDPAAPPQKVRVDGWTKEIDERLQAVQQGQAAVIIGYESIQSDGIPDGFASFPEIAEDIPAGTSWSMESHLVIISMQNVAEP